MQNQPKYYRRLGGWESFQCVVCNQIYDNIYDAEKCCQDKKPWLGLAHYEISKLLEKSVKLPYRRTLKKQSREKTEYPDKWGHFTRSEKHKIRDYYKAFRTILDEWRQEANADLENAYGDVEFAQTTKRHASALQALALAFHYGNWENVKAAAFRLAEEHAEDILNAHHVKSEQIADTLDFIEELESEL